MTRLQRLRWRVYIGLVRMIVKSRRVTPEQEIAAASEVERLTTAYENAVADLSAEHNRFTKAEADAARYREALESIAAMPYATDAWQIARAVLDEDEDGAA